MVNQRLLWEKLIVALDLDSEKEIEKIVKALAPKKVKFKIGSIAFTKFGPQLVRKFTKKNIDIFVDLKLYDIPNTMKETARVITEMGCWAFTVHIQAGAQALREVKKAVVTTAKKYKIRKPLILGVTVLTSEVNTKGLMDLVKMASESKLDGVISSARETAQIKRSYPNLKIITPGIRNYSDGVHDQRRVVTAQYAFTAGKADYIVAGRSIISNKDYPKDYLKAAELVLRA